MRNSSYLGSLMLLCILVVGPVSATPEGFGLTGDSQCSGSIFRVNEVSRRPRITNRPAPEYTPAARRNRISGNVVLIIVLCSTGKVTDAKVVQGLPYGLTESCVEAAKRIEFEPAEKDGHAVSVKMEIEYNFDLF